MDRRMIYKKDSEKKTRGKGANGTQARPEWGRQGRNGEGRAAMRAHDGRCRGGAARNLLIEGP